MSADNWGTCPRCNDKGKKLEGKYGKIPEQEYLDILEELHNTKMNSSLREDFEIRTDNDGVFHVKYSCSCSECGFNFQYKHEEKLKF